MNKQRAAKQNMVTTRFTGVPPLKFVSTHLLSIGAPIPLSRLKAGQQSIKKSAAVQTKKEARCGHLLSIPRNLAGNACKTWVSANSLCMEWTSRAFTFFTEGVKTKSS
jgi:hypothetical protein